MQLPSAITLLALSNFATVLSSVIPNVEPVVGSEIGSVVNSVPRSVADGAGSVADDAEQVADNVDAGAILDNVVHSVSKSVPRSLVEAGAGAGAVVNTPVGSVKASLGAGVNVGSIGILKRQLPPCKKDSDCKGKNSSWVWSHIKGAACGKTGVCVIKCKAEPGTCDHIANKMGAPTCQSPDDTEVCIACNTGGKSPLTCQVFNLPPDSK